jgi:hypothetical protein
MLRHAHLRPGRAMTISVQIIKPSTKNLAARATEYSDLLKIFFVIVAAGWALCEYKDKQREIKVERTVEYTKRAGTAEISAAELKLTNYWTSQETLDKLKALPKKDKAAFGELVLKEVENLKTEVWTMYRFYNSVATCVNAQLCEPRAACDSFKQDLDIFVENYLPYFDKLRADYSFDALAEIQRARKACAETP